MLQQGKDEEKAWDFFPQRRESVPSLSVSSMLRPFFITCEIMLERSGKIAGSGVRQKIRGK